MAKKKYEVISNGFHTKDSSGKYRELAIGEFVEIDEVSEFAAAKVRELTDEQAKQFVVATPDESEKKASKK